MNQVKNYNYVLGTQAFGATYHFTDMDPVDEIAGRIVEMGSNMIKCYANGVEDIDRLVEKYDFDRVFVWYYPSGANFRAEYYPEQQAESDYKIMYDFAKHLLEKYSGTGKEFYIGHWEGDWYYIDNYNGEQEKVADNVTKYMIDWENNRQRAVDDARRDTEYENVEVWNYLELNRPVDAIERGYDRLINRVLPYTNVDYVSYSAYDSMDLKTDEVAKVIDAIYEALPEKESVVGPRVFIGEMGQPAINCDFDGEYHARRNLVNIKKYLKCDVKFVLYWQMYDNETESDGSCRGFWLINDKNEKQPLYYAFESIFAQAKVYVKDYLEKNGKTPSIGEYREFLLTLPEFNF